MNACPPPLDVTDRFSVLPVGPNKKPPMPWAELQARRATEAELTEWARRYRPTGWAVVTGRISGNFVLDFDGAAGLETLRKLGLEPHVRTGSGGFHVYFEHPGWPVPTVNSKTKRELGARWPGLDIRADGGYAIAWGQSQYGEYKWLRPAELEPLAKLPVDLRELLGLARPPAMASSNDTTPALPNSNGARADAETLVRRAIERIGSEGRNNAGFWLAAQLRDNGYSRLEAEPAMRNYAGRVPATNTKGQRECYTAAEALASLREAFTRPARDPWEQKSAPRAASRGSADQPEKVTDRGPGPIRDQEDGPSIFDSLAPYPRAIDEAGYHGIAGEFVRLVEPHTEADPNWLLVLFLAYAGNIFGRRAFVWAGGDRHYGNLFVCAVGPTSGGRKGSATGPVEMFFRAIDDEYLANSVQSGLSSGEGIIWAVRDQIVKREKVKGSGKSAAVAYEDVVADEGVQDKRLLVRQGEFFAALQVMKRQGNTLSPTIRDCWDRADLKSMVKNSPAKATGAHVSIVGNITKEELLRGMLAEEADNGFANRFLWVCSRRSKCLPEGGRMWEVETSEGFRELQRRFNRIHYLMEGPISRDGEAADIWGCDGHEGGVYRELTRERHGMFGACTARAAAQVLRLSLIYALLDGCAEIRRQHLEAALECWRYCEESARYIFGDAIGDPTADQILVALRRAPGGMTRSEIRDLFDRNRSTSQLNTALLLLHKAGLVRFEKEPTAGRPTERWFAVEKQ